MTHDTAPNVLDFSRYRRAVRFRSKEITLLPAGASIAAVVYGRSLHRLGINDGDRLTVERCDSLPYGTLGLVATPYGNLVRLVCVTPDYVRLEAADPSAPTLYLPHADVRAVGRVVKLVRRFPPPGESEGA